MRLYEHKLIAGSLYIILSDFSLFNFAIDFF